MIYPVVILTLIYLGFMPGYQPFSNLTSTTHHGEAGQLCADLDGNGKAECFMQINDKTVELTAADGKTLKWQSEEKQNETVVQSHLFLIDLNHDSQQELLWYQTVQTADGDDYRKLFVIGRKHLEGTTKIDVVEARRFEPRWFWGKDQNFNVLLQKDAKSDLQIFKWHPERGWTGAALVYE